MVSAATPPVLDDADLDVALDAARIPDDDGRAPVDPEYTETFDLHYAAAEAFEMKATRATANDVGGLESFTSEGSAFKRRPGAGFDEFMRLAAFHRAKSTAAPTGALSVIDMETPSRGRPRSAVVAVTNAE
jgi:hypothetical protein